MDILMSLHKKWSNKILDGSKILEFRNNIGKEFSIGSKVYIYETSKNNGCKKIVGEFTIKDIQQIPKSRMGCYPFLLYFSENIKPDKENVEAIKKVYDIKMTNYDNGIKASYIFLPEVLEELNKTDKLPDLLEMSKEEYLNFMKLQKKSTDLINECDDWLINIGYYNDYLESYYKYYIEIENPIKYDKPLELTDFYDKKDEKIKKAPQSWMYCKKA